MVSPMAQLRLLVSYSATILKAAQGGGGCECSVVGPTATEEVDKLICISLDGWASLHPSLANVTAAAAPAMLCLVLPRWAALASSRAIPPPQLPSLTADLSMVERIVKCHFKSPRQALSVLGSCHATALLRISVTGLRDPPVLTQRSGMHLSLIRILSFADSLSNSAFWLATEGCEGAPPRSPQLRDLLAGPILELLGSPLLSLLAQRTTLPAPGFRVKGVP